jgi:predicted ATP-dependent serine protease
VTGLERRLREASRLGYSRAIVPRGGGSETNVAGIEAVRVGTLRDAITAALATSSQDIEPSRSRVAVAVRAAD